MGSGRKETWKRDKLKALLTAIRKDAEKGMTDADDYAELRFHSGRSAAVNQIFEEIEKYDADKRSN